MRTRTVGAAVAVGVLAVGLVLSSCGGPVTPRVEPSTWRFEGFDVVSYVPEDPVGLDYLFHGSQGSADFATKVETVGDADGAVSFGFGAVDSPSVVGATEHLPVDLDGQAAPSVGLDVVRFAPLGRFEAPRVLAVAVADLEYPA
jgi:hypothetical protein